MKLHTDRQFDLAFSSMQSIPRLSRTIAASAALLIAVELNAAPLTLAYQQTDTLGLEVVALGISAAPAVSSASEGTLNISTQASLGNFEQAFLYAVDANHTSTMTATFNGMSLLGGTPVGPHANAVGLSSSLQTFRWDVTNELISGVTNYSWSFSEQQDINMQQGSSISLVALALIYKDASLATSNVTLFDGMDFIGPFGNSSTINFTNLPAGPTSTVNLTAFDNNISPPSSSGETITFNGTNVGGPLDANLGINGSLVQGNATSNTAMNPMTITTNADQFGWVLSGTVTPIPLPTAAWLYFSAIAGLAALKGRT